ncbi:MAG: 50S ribosomal protein L23 [Candidatus Taylorbacteria bacterium RIFCSPHIGHO2_02_FULL_46_13]|uniref:50S ribosomal protein L23 n=1 Tax=Candidatus Taylorbacteria bacterium RIFCSPHIGHO2_02_FULL_46_13 TaxID=1802312 RepID=A0A1G2MQ15_9BACT|nr:MAG: 50S ribosomal protein L23 [Candidatus Taylorbacteria bacterium RIFCSPHIGHO2_02_FULL_46_13]
MLLGIRVTEKVSLLAEKNNVYTFNVSSDANKQNVAQAIMHLYKVKPIKVSIMKVPSKRVFVRGKRGVKRGGRKAYVFFKKGEKVEIS